MATVKDIVGDAHFFEETVTSDKIKKLLDNVASGSGMASVMEKTEGMKYLLAMQSQGRDVSEFYPDVVRNVIVKNVELKKLVYMYLVHNADTNATCRELALLAINSFQRDLAGPNQLIRSLALRVMCSIRVKEIVQIQLLAVKKCCMDSSPYVRKTAAHSLSKIFTLDNDQKPELVAVISRLLGDRTVMVLGSAITVFNEVCPERLDLLHPHYRKLCQVLPDVDEWGQIAIMGTLLRYARTQFLNPKADVADSKRARKASSDDSDDEAAPSTDLDEDHKLLLRCVLPLLKSRNSGVVLAVASIYQYLGPGGNVEDSLVGKAVVRVMRNHREIEFVVLTNIAVMAAENPGMFRKHIKDFYVTDTEPAFIRKQKMEVLALLVSGENSGLILKEFTRYVADANPDFVVASVLAVGRIADAMPELAPRVLGGLMGLVNHPSEAVVAASVIVIRQLLQRHPANEVIVKKLVHRLPTIKIPAARSAIIWILGEFQNHASIALMAPDALRMLAKDFKSEDVSVKSQILNLAAKLALRSTGSTAAPTQLLLRYVLEMAKFDDDYDLRDRARFLRRIILAGPSDALNLASRAAEILLAPKPAPLPIQSGSGAGFARPAAGSSPVSTAVVTGTLSVVVGHNVPGYTALPDFPTVKPSSKVRDEAPPEDTPKAGSKAKAKAKAAPKPDPKKKAGGGFYSDDDKESSAEDSSSSDGSGSSGSGSESGDASDSSDGGSSSGSEEEEGSDEGTTSEDEESSSEEETTSSDEE